MNKPISKNVNSRQYVIAGIQLTCSHCGGNNFARDVRQLNSAGLTAIGMDWINKSAEIFVCTRCGKIEWFDSLNNVS